MKKRAFYTMFLTATALSIGITFSAYAEEIGVRDENGKYIEELEIPDEINGRQFSSYIENSNLAIYTQPSEVLYESELFMYDIYTLSPVAGGWYRDQKLSNPWDEEYSTWFYVIPNGTGCIAKNSWILDNGNVYLTSSRGQTKHGETIIFENVADTTDFIYNVQTMQWEPLPFTQVGNTHILALPYNMNITYDDFIKSLSGERYETWKAQQALQPEKQTQAENNLDWSMFDIFISQAMVDRGFYSYEVISRERIEDTFNGIGVYKVKVAEAGSHSTKYLRVYINADGSYWKSSF